MTSKYDFKQQRIRSQGIGTNIYLLGTSVDGPYMEPVYIRSKEEARKIFGDHNKGTLVKAFDEAYDRNREISIHLMRITGESASIQVEGPDVDDTSYNTFMTLTSTRAGELYNSVLLSLEFNEALELPALTMSTPQGIFSYVLPEYITVGELSRLISQDCRANKHTIMVSTGKPDELVLDIFPFFVQTDIYLTGGSDGLDATRDQLYIACSMAYNLLLGQPVDVIVPVDMYIDDIHPSYLYGTSMYGSAFYSSTRDYLQLLDTHNDNRVVSYHEQLIDFCREQTSLGYMSHGVMGFRPLSEIPRNVMNDNSYIMRIMEASSFRDRYGFLEFINNNWIDKGFYISVVSSELVYNEGTPQEYFASGAVRYASLITGYYDGTTNMSIGDDVSLRYELSDATRSDLSKVGIVTFRDSVRLGLVVQSGVTPSLPETDYHNFANVRMVQMTVAYMNEAIQIVYDNDYNTDVRRRMLEELVQSRLLTLKQMDVLENYSYEIQFLMDDSEGEILLTLQTKYTVEGIQIGSTISAGESTR